MKKKICGKEMSEAKLKLNSSLYRNDRSITFPVLLGNSLVQSINKQGMHVPIDEHSHFSALSSTNDKYSKVPSQAVTDWSSHQSWVPHSLA